MAEDQQKEYKIMLNATNGFHLIDDTAIHLNKEQATEKYWGYVNGGENPNDLNTRYELAKSQIINKDYSGSINNLLFIIEKNKDWNNNKAKAELLNIFSLLGDSDPLTMSGRSRLSNLIFK